MDVANEILDAIEIIVDKKIRENTAQIYPGICKSISGNTCVMSINGRDNTVQFYGSTPTVGTIYRVFVPNGNMSMAFIIAINDDSSSAKSASIFVTGLSETDTVTASKDGKTVLGKLTQKPNQLAHGLPDGYTELECIIGGSTQYINTGFTPNQDTRVVLDHKFIGNKTNCCGFGSRVSYESRGFQYNADYNGDKTKAFVQYGGTYADAGNLYGSERHIVDFNKNNFYHDDVLKKTFSYTSFTAPGPLYLFAMNQNGAVKDISDMILYRCQIYDNGQIVRDFIPAKRNSDSVVGLYDLANSIFYTNAGTGTFTAGAEIPQNIDGFLIDKIKDYGTWTVTATDGTNTVTQDVLVDAAEVFTVEVTL